MAKRRQKQNPRNDALMALVELAGGYGVATTEQIAQVAQAYGLECWEMEGLYFDATETAGEE